jgi:ubiquinone/menaquinone biosynthesis C-methylase UbiE
VRQIKDMYDRGENITLAMREAENTKLNSEKIIEVSYDIQTGSYMKLQKQDKYKQHLDNFSGEIARVIKGLCEPKSIMEAGVGEATTLSRVIQSLKIKGLESYGFDISWSRMGCARRWLNDEKVTGVHLSAASLLTMPYADNSIDVVYTAHTIEPNSGKEEVILKDLYRITRKYLILLEPGYELASDEARARMDKFGSCRDLVGHAKRLGYKVIEHKLFPFTANPLNPTALTIIEKNTDAPHPGHVVACPIYKTKLEEIGGMLYSPEAFMVYPVIGGIPCLRVENGILASFYPEYYKDA